MQIQLNFDLAYISNAIKSMKNMDFSLISFLTSIASSFMIFGGIIPYIPQYLQIRSTKNAEGFSLYVCFTLLVANMLRIFFWFGHRFELPLLIQSIVMILTMFIMIHLCISVKRSTEIVAQKNKQFTDSGDENIDEKYTKTLVAPVRFTDFDMSSFWQWTDFSSYLQCMLTISLFVGMITMALITLPVYVETLGLCAVLTEAMLGMPQFYRNFKNKSTSGMSVQMVLLWLAGDLFKTVYFITRSAPLQFWLCGLLQVSLDCAILIQVAMYQSHKSATQ